MQSIRAFRFPQEAGLITKSSYKVSMIQNKGRGRDCINFTCVMVFLNQYCISEFAVMQERIVTKP